MLYEFLTLTLLAVSAAPVEVRPLAGPSREGDLLSLSDTELVIDVAGPAEPTSIPISSLLHVRPLQVAAATQTEATVWLKLTDGSLLGATAYTVANSQATVTLVTGENVAIPTRAIDWVRFKKQSEELAAAWRELHQQQAPGDRLVVRRVVMQPNPAGGAPQKLESLDFLSGILFDITAESLKFEFNGQTIDVGREKAEGLIYHHAAGRALPAPLCVVQTVNGDTWQTKSLALEDDSLALVSVAGVSHSLPLEQAKLLDFSAGKIVYLSDLEPETSQWHSFFGGKNELESLQQLFAPRRDQNFDGGPLKLNGQTYPKGLALHSHSELVYRLPGAFRKLGGVAGIDDSLGENGHVILRIYGDKTLLLEQVITGADEQPYQLDLDIDGVRKVRIEVDFGENLDIADHLNLCDIRIMK
jgi:hypothetical protein